MNYTFSDKIATLQPSAIREILKFTSKPGYIPFAAGNPAPESFPKEEIAEITADILKNDPIAALQYSVTEGYAPLRETLSKHVKQKYNIGTDSDDLLIMSGAQQGIELSTKALCNEGDTIICESPSFIGSLNAFRSYNAKLCGVDMEPDGMDMNKLEAALKTEKNVRFIYVIPNFQNPSGITMSTEKRRTLYALAEKYNTLILEDNPYGDLRFTGEHCPSLKSMDTSGIVIYCGTFSKIISPGLRVGFIVAPKPLTGKITVCKQASAVHTSILPQMIVHEFMKRYGLEGHIEKNTELYHKKMLLMHGELERHLNGWLDYAVPEGGLFIYAKIPDNVDVNGFVAKALERFVAIVPGTAFLTNRDMPCKHIRLNYSTPTNEQIEKGVEILKQVSLEFC